MKENKILRFFTEEMDYFCFIGFILSFFSGLIATGICLFGMYRIRKSGLRGNGFAIAGVLISILSTFYIGLFLLYLNKEAKPLTEMIEVMDYACERIDRNGNYSDRLGTIVCDNFKCNYYKEDGEKVEFSCFVE